MKKFLALLATAAMTASAADVTTATLGAIEEIDDVVIAVDLSAYAKTADVASDARVDALEAQTNAWNTAATKAGSAVQTVSKASGAATELTVSQSGDAVTVGLDLSAYAKTADLPEETDPVWTADKASYLTKTEAGTTYVEDDATYQGVVSAANSAVKTVAKATGGAEELTVTQTGTGVTIDVDLSAYAKTADAYVHPSYAAAAAAFIKVGRDATGHVVIGDSIALADLTGLGAAAASDVTALGTRVTTIEGSTNSWTTTATGFTALKTAAGGITSADITTLSECIDAVQTLIESLK